MTDPHVYELAGQICRSVRDRRLERIGERLDPKLPLDPLADLPEEDRQNWIDVAEAVLRRRSDGDDADRLRALVLDWDRYTLTIKDPAWRDEMRRAVVVEMQFTVDRLRKECE